MLIYQNIVVLMTKTDWNILEHTETYVCLRELELSLGSIMQSKHLVILRPMCSSAQDKK